MKTLGWRVLYFRR